MPSRANRLISLLLCVFLLAGCAGTDLPVTSAAEEPASSPASAPDPSPVDLVFSVSRDAGEPLRAAAEYFCGEYTRLTGRSAEIRDVIAPDADLLAGRAQVALLNKRRQFEFNYLLSATATPFLYTGYHNFTMRANAQSTLDMLESSLRAQNHLVPLAAFYQGSLHLLSDFAVVGYQPLELQYFAISDDNTVKESVERILGIPLTADTDAERFALYEEEEVRAVEVSLDYLAELDAFPRPSYLTLSAHNLIPVWMVATEELYDALDKETQAALTEAAAVMSNMIDDAYREADAIALRALYEQSELEIASEFAAVRNRVFNAMPTLSEDASTQRKLARELVVAMRKIG